ncbi:MAG: beta-hydroxyacyl-ACP dehydratase [Deltaproteobacteria bacterium]|nr:beta-hydroxyacyl-ACP dehydratase [Deltaproteobacteria bacterium]
MTSIWWKAPGTIRRILPHREPFLFVDRVVAFEPEKEITAEFTALPGEWYFAGHFPERPILPGVLVAEALAQASGLLLGLTREEREALEGEDPGPLSLAGMDVKFSSPAGPGDTLRLNSRLVKRFGHTFLFRVEASVGERRIAAGTLILAGDL